VEHPGWLSANLRLACKSCGFQAKALQNPTFLMEVVQKIEVVTQL
jgi:hypothetical protein